MITIAICSNSKNRARWSMETNAPVFAHSCEVLVVLDSAESAEDLYKFAPDFNLRILYSGKADCLSHARNVALTEAKTSAVLFLDDDVRLNFPAFSAVERALSSGYAIVGVPLLPVDRCVVQRWNLTSGQHHYLGLHSPASPGSIWGACMALDLEILRRHNLRFRDDLGRQDGVLLSGEDTALLNKLREYSAKEIFLDEVHVIHDFTQARLRFPYLLRRALWQGRTEQVRHNILQGAWKELKRNWYGIREAPVRGFSLALVYFAAFCLGAVTSSRPRYKAGSRAATSPCSLSAIDV